LNGCGECGGIGFLDAVGTCCKGTLDAGGLCCPSGQLDECGVCDGVGETCSTHVELVLEEDAELSEDCLSEFLLPLVPSSNEDIVLSYEDDGHVHGEGHVVEVDLDGGDINLPLFEQNINDALAEANVDTCSIQSVVELSKHSMCGNGICEIGESEGIASRYPCHRDCPFTITACRMRGEDGVVGDESQPCSGNGRCFFAEQGRCECHDGYIGPGCDRCASGYYPLHDVCHPRQSAFFPENEQNKTVEDGTSPPLRNRAGIQNSAEVQATIVPGYEEDGSSGDNRALIITLACFGLAGLLIIPACIGFVIRNYRMNKRDIEKLEDQPGSSSQDLLNPQFPQHPRHIPASHQTHSPSLLDVYLKEFNEFQNSPPWVGSIENQRIYRPPYLPSNSDSPPRLNSISLNHLTYEPAYRSMKSSASVPSNLSTLGTPPSALRRISAAPKLEMQSSKRVSFKV